MGEIFGGEPVLVFKTETDRRKFFKIAGAVGVGVTYVAMGGAWTPLRGRGGGEVLGAVNGGRRGHPELRADTGIPGV